jgi:hypothetical protein
MGDRTPDRICNYCAGFQVRGMAVDSFLYTQLPGVDHCGPAAERQSSRSGGSVRWRGESDGIRSTRRGHRTVAGDDLVRGNVHGMRDGVGFALGSFSGTGQFGDLQHDQARLEARARGDSGKNPGACSGACHTASDGSEPETVVVSLIEVRTSRRLAPEFD